MGWTLDKKSGIWKCSQYSDLQYAEIVNFAEHGEPFSPYEPGFDQDFTPDFSKVIIEMPQSEVMNNGYGKLVQATDFPVVGRLLNDTLTLKYGQYSLQIW